MAEKLGGCAESSLEALNPHGAEESAFTLMALGNPSVTLGQRNYMICFIRRITWLQAEGGWEKENVQPRRPARELLADVQVKG